jgi:hypothetical protein
MPAALLVFDQRDDARIEVDAWNAQAERFFATRIGLAEATRPSPAPRTEEARFVVAPNDEPPGIRAVSAGPRQASDLALAQAAEAAAGGGGLALLAARCPIVWRVAREHDDDPLALRLAAILASVLLGPIVDPKGPEIFGVKTARAKLESLRPR